MRFINVYFFAILVPLCYPLIPIQCCLEKMCFDKCDGDKTPRQYFSCLATCGGKFQSKWDSMMTPEWSFTS
ncbi:unnamed protein product [Cylicocyclus nassatus]|uniref:Uncharacterized protein n=1 Tax=Cylicocyclus nassatus TaxID=53992 RepID=A0AA36DW90_CYLNA|nr:unnamed protein product [Cylicocyclus nassatus]